MAIGFRTIENFRSKLAYVDAIVTARCFFEEAMLDRWAKLSAQISAAASKRNELVHRQAVLDPRGGVGKRIVLVEGGWYLKPRIDTGQETPNKINIRDLAQRGFQFRDLHFARQLWSRSFRRARAVSRTSRTTTASADDSFDRRPDARRSRTPTATISEVTSTLGALMKASPKKLPPTTDEIEVLRRMLHTPPTPHKAKTSKPPSRKMPAKKSKP